MIEVLPSTSFLMIICSFALIVPDSTKLIVKGPRLTSYVGPSNSAVSLFPKISLSEKITESMIITEKMIMLFLFLNSLLFFRLIFMP